MVVVGPESRCVWLAVLVRIQTPNSDLSCRELIDIEPVEEWKRKRGSGVGVKPPCRAPGSTEYRAASHRPRVAVARSQVRPQEWICSP